MSSGPMQCEPSPEQLQTFDILHAPVSDHDARLGRLRFRGRSPVDTPHYIAISSRGVVPHLTQDMMRDQSSIKTLYTAFEDYAERLPQPPPLYSFPCPATDSPLRRFIALQNDALLVLGPRRLPPVSTPKSNTYTSIGICTSVGFRSLEISSYVEAAHRLRPDVVIGPADVELGEEKPSPGLSRKDKMGERTLAWMRGIQERLDGAKAEGSKMTLIWAPVLPIEAEMQRSYLEHLEDVGPGKYAGLVLYDNASIDAIPSVLQRKPRFSLVQPSSPRAVLHAVSLGVDLVALPFISSNTEGGIALTFVFPAPPSVSEATSPLPLGVNMWSPEHATDLSPLSPGCTCYACTSHHRAYIRHLLNAKEMLAWVLLQVHNHHIVDSFFRGIRASIASGSFAQDTEAFNRAYETDLPAAGGDGPRIRGYQTKSSGPAPKKANKPAYHKAYAPAQTLDDLRKKKAEGKEARAMEPGSDAADLEQGGFAELFDEK